MMLKLTFMAALLAATIAPSAGNDVLSTTTVSGRYVRIGTLISGSHLNLNEVEAFGSNGERLEPKGCKMASTWEPYSCDLCTDGYNPMNSSIPESKSLCHTGSTKYVGNPLLWVDYGNNVAISKVVVTNRNPNCVDGCNDRIVGATLTITSDEAGKHVAWSGTFQGAQGIYTFSISEPPTPPPNTGIYGMTLVALVAGTAVADDAYWAEVCKNIPSTARGIVVTMGSVRVCVYAGCMCVQ